MQMVLCARPVLTSRLMGADAPDLVAQRVSAGSEAFAALQRAFSSNNEGIRSLAEPRLLGLCRDVLREYASAERRALAEKAGKCAGLPQPAQLLDSATPLALEALAFVRDLDAQAFAKHCAWLVPVLSELIVCQSVPLTNYRGRGVRDQTAVGALIDDAPGARPDADGRGASGAGLQPAGGRRVADAAPGDGVAGVQANRPSRRPDGAPFPLHG